MKSFLYRQQDNGSLLLDAHQEDIVKVTFTDTVTISLFLFVKQAVDNTLKNYPGADDFENE